MNLLRRLVCTLGITVLTATATCAMSPAADRDKPTEQKASPAEIQQLIEQLGDRKQTVRDNATKRLIEIGRPALAAVREAAKSDDLEVRTRAQRVADEIVSGQDRKARAAVDRYLAGVPGAQAAQVKALRDEHLTECFPDRSFFAVTFRQFPVARIVPAPLKASNVFVVPRGGKLKVITEFKELKGLFRSGAKPVKSEKAAKHAVMAWLTLATQLANDGFYQFAIPGQDVKAGAGKAGIEASGRATLLRGGNGQITVAMTFTEEGKLDAVDQESKLRPGPRPICQATKLLDADPVVRRMAEQDLLFMGSAAADYLAEQRARARPELQRAIDRLWRRILADEP
jgi:hypothetical protein